jgi:xanthine dehydrogenase accessory factor
MTPAHVTPSAAAGTPTWRDHDPLRATAQAWLAAGRAAIELQVRHARGSVPREAGTRMLVAADAVAGTIGGGHLELQAIAAARAQLAAGDGGVHDTPIALGPSLGQCCGGALVLRRQPLSDQGLRHWPQPQPLFTLQLYGAGHVGRAIARLLADIACRVQWIDERADEFPVEPGPPHLQRVCVDAVEAEVAHAPPGAFYLVLTHRHDLDERITQAVLARGDFGYLGLIGSATKRARFLHRFEARGVPHDTLARLTCPIGVPGIAGKQPELIAVAVVAQLLQVAGRAQSAPI